MKKRIFNLSLVVLLLFAMILGLTACGDEDGDDKKKEADTSDAKSVIEAMYEAVNDQDASALADLTDFDALSKSLDEDVTKKSFKSDWEDFFEDNEDLEITASKIKKLEDDEEVLDSLLEVYDSYDEYIEEIEDDYGIDNVVIYVAKLEVSDDYEDFFDDNAIVAGKDVIYLTKNDGEYQLIYSYFLMCLYYDYEDEYDYEDDYDYDYDDDDDDDYSYNFEIDEDVVEDLKEYEGKQTGKQVKDLADYVVENTTSDFTLYIDYYGEDGIIDEYMINTESEIKDFKKKLDDSHKYKVEIEPSEYGYCDIEITY